MRIFALTTTRHPATAAPSRILYLEAISVPDTPSRSAHQAGKIQSYIIDGQLPAFGLGW